MFNVKSWCADYLKATVRQMTLDETKTMFGLMFEPNFVADDELKEEFCYRLIKTRSEAIGLNLSDRLILMIMLITEGNPGKMVMMMYAIRSKMTQCDMSEFCSLFPNGFPTDSELDRLWSKQKGPGGNGLDQPVEW